MPQYDGIVTLEEDQVEVVIDLHPNRVHLWAGDLEIGDWAPGECAIASLGDGVYAITAESHSLRFVPRDPGRFEDGLNHGTGYGLSPAPDLEGSGDQLGRHVKTLPQTESSRETEAPPPKPVTLVLFYGLATVTALLAIWALLSIVA